MEYSQREKLTRALVRQQCIKEGVKLGDQEVKNLVRDLFDCEIFNVTPSGKPVFLEFKKIELEKMFGR